jgi:septation ring formation regulator EzrA
LKTINRENRRLQDYEEQVADIETMLNETMTGEEASPAEIERCRNELADARRKLRQQRQMLFQDMNETVQQVEVWLQKIEDIEALLKTGNPVQDIPQFLHKIDAEQQAIEDAAIFKSLQALVAANADIERLIDQVKLQVQERIIRVLVEDVSRRDEQLASLRREVAATGAALAELQKKETISQQKIKNLRQLYQVFSTSLIPALTMGAVIGILMTKVIPAAQNLAWPLAIAGITMFFWIGGLIYIQVRQ